jgi:Fe-S cluster biogenesis protein NfuA
LTSKSRKLPQEAAENPPVLRRGVARPLLDDGQPFVPPVLVGTPRHIHRSKGSAMVSHESVELVLDRVRPYLIADGGNVELVEVAGNDARIRLTGMCAGCPSAHLTLYLGIEAALRADIAGFGRLDVV